MKAAAATVPTTDDMTIVIRLSA